MKLTCDPAQTVVAVADTETLTASKGFTVMAMLLEMAGVPVGQVASEVSKHETASPFDGI